MKKLHLKLEKLRLKKVKKFFYGLLDISVILTP